MYFNFIFLILHLLKSFKYLKFESPKKKVKETMLLSLTETFDRKNVSFMLK